jgi:hypothetical protein
VIPGAPTDFSRGLINQLSVTIRKENSAGRWLAVSVITLILVSNCSLLSRRVKLGEEFTLKPGEKVSVAGADLSIRLKEVGHQWYVDRRAESPYVELELSDVGAAGQKLTLSDIKTVGEFNIRLVAANPFRDNGGPDCKLIVTHR